MNKTNNTRSLTIRMEEDTERTLNDLAESQGRTRTEIIKRAIGVYWLLSATKYLKQ